MDYIIHLEADLNLILKRLKLRRRVCPKNEDINNENIKFVVKKSINEINNFIMNIEKSKIKIITIKNNKNLKVTKDNILNFLNLKI